MNLPNPLSLIVLGHIHKDERVYYFDELKVKGSKKKLGYFWRVYNNHIYDRILV